MSVLCEKQKFFIDIIYRHLETYNIEDFENCKTKIETETVINEKQ